LGAGQISPGVEFSKESPVREAAAEKEVRKTKIEGGKEKTRKSRPIQRGMRKGIFAESLMEDLLMSAKISISVACS